MTEKTAPTWIVQLVLLLKLS